MAEPLKPFGAEAGERNGGRCDGSVVAATSAAVSLGGRRRGGTARVVQNPRWLPKSARCGNGGLAMPIFAECPVCGKRFRFLDDKAGQVLPCRYCGGQIHVPGTRRRASRAAVAPTAEFDDLFEPGPVGPATRRRTAESPVRELLTNPKVLAAGGGIVGFFFLLWLVLRLFSPKEWRPSPELLADLDREHALQHFAIRPPKGMRCIQVPDEKASVRTWVWLGPDAGLAVQERDEPNPDRAFFSVQQQGRRCWLRYGDQSIQLSGVDSVRTGRVSGMPAARVVLSHTTFDDVGLPVFPFRTIYVGYWEGTYFRVDCVSKAGLSSEPFRVAEAAARTLRPLKPSDVLPKPKVKHSSYGPGGPGGATKIERPLAMRSPTRPATTTASTTPAGRSSPAATAPPARPVAGSRAPTTERRSTLPVSTTRPSSFPVPSRGGAGRTTVSVPSRTTAPAPSRTARVSATSGPADSGLASRRGAGVPASSPSSPSAGPVRPSSSTVTASRPVVPSTSAATAVRRTTRPNGSTSAPPSGSGTFSRSTAQQPTSAQWDENSLIGLSNGRTHCIDYVTLPRPLVLADGAVYDLQTFEQVGRVSLPRGDVEYRQAVSSDLKYFAFAAPRAETTSEVQVVSLSTGETVRTIKYAAESRPHVVFLAFCDEKHLVVGYRRSLHVYDVETGEDRPLPCSTYNDYQITLSPNGKYVAVATSEGLFVVNLSTARIVASMGVPPGMSRLSFAFCRAVAFSSDVTELAAILNDRLVVWNNKAEPIEEIPLETSSFDRRYGIQWLPDKSGWLVYNQVLVDRRSKLEVWRLVRDFPGGDLPVWLLGKEQVCVAVRRGLSGPVLLKRLSIPWDRIQPALQAVSEQEALVRPGSPVAIEVQVGTLQYGDKAKTAERLREAASKRLKALELVPAETAPIRLLIHYSEARGQTLTIRNLLPGSGPDEVQVPETVGTCLAQLVDSQTGRVLWKHQFDQRPGMVLSREPTPQGVREDMFERVESQVANLAIPRFIPKSRPRELFPIVTRVQ